MSLGVLSALLVFPARQKYSGGLTTTTIANFVADRLFLQLSLLDRPKKCFGCEGEKR